VRRDETIVAVEHSGVLYIVAGGAEPVARVSGLVDAALGRGWDTCLVLTPTAARWLDAEVPALARRTGHPVRSAYKLPGDPDVLPEADAMIVAPATFNMINQWAAGISESLALGLINEALGRGIPVAAAPWVNGPLSRHPAYGASLDRLRGAGVTIVVPGPEGLAWTSILDAVAAAPA
jgi:hypothetical protein